MVSIHASVKDATKTRHNSRWIVICFNPRICKRCDLKVDADRNTLWVSIHASVKDATIGSAYIRSRRDVSIHASVKDATYHRVSCRRGSCVSIHASVKDATKHSRYTITPNEVSIHASVKDATLVLNLVVLSGKFQSTHL